MLNKNFRSSSLFVLAVLAALPAFAQQDQGQIAGTVLVPAKPVYSVRGLLQPVTRACPVLQTQPTTVLTY